MADFTINSLVASTPVSTDNFLKSSSDGTLTKVPFTDLVSAVKENGGLNGKYGIFTLASGVTLRLAIDNKTVVGEVRNTNNAKLTYGGGWHTFADRPSGWDFFNSLSLININPLGVIAIRCTVVDGVTKLQYQCLIPEASQTYIEASGATTTNFSA